MKPSITLAVETIEAIRRLAITLTAAQVAVKSLSGGIKTPKRNRSSKRKMSVGGNRW